MSGVAKRFPADTDKEKVILKTTFLTNKEINGELYAYFQGKSEPVEIDGKKETRVYKSRLDKAKKIGDIIGVSQPTYRKHLGKLIEEEYLIDKGAYYLLPEKEDFFFMIPLDSLQFLLDTVKKPVFKTLIFLGHQYEWKQKVRPGEGYVFTLEELATNIGIKLNNNQREYTKINNYLEALESFGFIKYTDFYEGKIPKKRLYYFTKDRKKLNENFY